MFERLFNNKKESNDSKPKTEEVAVKSHSYPKEVMEIHHEFHIASDLLLEQAKSIITEAATKDVDKVNRLEGLGFKQAAQVTEIKPLIEKAKLSKEQIELVNCYSIKYPNNKFITGQQVKAICYKYNLVCGDVGRFKGFVPEKNLREIEGFKVDENDVPKLLFQLDSWPELELPINEIDETYLSEYGKAYFMGVNNLNYGYITDDSASPKCNLYDNEKCSIFKGFRFVRSTMINTNELQICAPLKDMDLSGMEIKKGYKLQKHIPDPVVLKRVKGGYLILTAWGDEASDELVVNQKFN